MKISTGPFDESFADGRFRFAARVRQHANQQLRPLGQFDFAEVERLSFDQLAVHNGRGNHLRLLAILRRGGRRIGVGGKHAVGRRLAGLNRERRRHVEARRQAFEFEFDLAVEFVLARGNRSEFFAAARVHRPILLGNAHGEIGPRRPHGELILVSIATEPAHVGHANQVVAVGRRGERDPRIAAHLSPFVVVVFVVQRVLRQAVGDERFVGPMRLDDVARLVRRSRCRRGGSGPARRRRTGPPSLRSVPLSPFRPSRRRSRSTEIGGRVRRNCGSSSTTSRLCVMSRPVRAPLRAARARTTHHPRPPVQPRCGRRWP